MFIDAINVLGRKHLAIMLEQGMVRPTGHRIAFLDFNLQTIGPNAPHAD